MDDLRSTFFCCGDQLHPPAGHRHLVVIYLVAVALVSLAAAAHQGWSANLFTLTSDLFPKRAVGSVVGIGGTAGSIGGMLIA